MNRTQFEAIRDGKGKVIRGDIRFARRQATSPALTVDGVEIDNDAGVQLRLNITYNPLVGSKTFNVHIPGMARSVASTSTGRRIDLPGAATSTASSRSAVPTETCPMTSWTAPICRESP